MSWLDGAFFSFSLSPYPEIPLIIQLNHFHQLWGKFFEVGYLQMFCMNI